jgi:hypothetical protein
MGPGMRAACRDGREAPGNPERRAHYQRRGRTDRPGGPPHQEVAARGFGPVLYDEAFTADAALAEPGETTHRYNAACEAARAGSGEGKDEPKPDDATRDRLREKARKWLRADLQVWSKTLERGNPQAPPAVVKQLAHWKVDTDLAGIRDDAELAKLPEPERVALRSLWADVEALRKKAEAKSTPAATK